MYILHLTQHEYLRHCRNNNAYCIIIIESFIIVTVIVM
jgi:hypothetical protein